MIVIGLSIYFYPTMQTKEIQSETEKYIKVLKIEQKENKEKKVKKKNDPVYQESFAYNKKIKEEDQKDFKDAWSYKQFSIRLSTLKDDKFGYLKIPAMHVELPLYLGASDEHLRRGAAILGETSLPIGTKSSNCVIAAHRGYSGIPFFRDIQALKLNDHVYVTNRWQTLRYRVDQIEVIEPYESDKVKIQEGKDMVTLITCHPYRGHGQYRYVVYCVRDPGKKEQKNPENFTLQKKIKSIQDSPDYQLSQKDIELEQRVRAAGGILIIIFSLATLIRCLGRK